MLGPDSYYTPESLAEKLLSYVQGAPTTAADFCVGDGGLLVAAVNRFPNVSCFGIDISHEVIKGRNSPSGHCASVILRMREP